jgi:pilus assembly protein CpaC
MIGAALAGLTMAWCAKAPAQQPMEQVPPVPTAPSVAGTEQAIRIEVGEQTTLRAGSGRNIKQVFGSRPGIVNIETIGMDPTIVRVTGTAIGTVDVTVVDDQSAATRYTLRVLPNLGYVRDTIARHFPRTNLTIEKVGEQTVVVSGELEHADQIASLMQIGESIVGKGYIVNNMRLAGVMQVQLEVCVAQVRRTEIRNMGFNFLGAGRDAVIQSTVGGLIPQPLTGPALSSESVPPGFLTSSRISGGIGSQAGATTNLVLGVFDEATSFFGFLQALRNENLAKILASPTLTTLSGRPAFFNVGGEEPFGTAGSVGTGGAGGGAGIQFKPFGTNVRFLPVVLGNGKIRIEVQPEVSFVTEQITQANIVAPRLESTRLETTVELESGQTMVIGGLIQNRLAGTTTKVPILGDLPFLGAGFRTVAFNEQEVEMLIIVTPYLVDPLDAAQRPTRLPGQETRTVTDFELFLEGILEAPRGQRPICPDGHYRPAHYWAPAHCFPYGTPKPGCGPCGANCGPNCGPESGAPANPVADTNSPSVTGAAVVGGSEVRVIHGPGATLRIEPMPPVVVEKLPETPLEADPLLPPQPPSAPPVTIVPVSQPAEEVDRNAEVQPAASEVQRPEPKEAAPPAPPPPERPME